MEPEDYVLIEMTSLKARKKEAESYPFNNDMMIEARLLTAQIGALKKMEYLLEKNKEG